MWRSARFIPLAIAVAASCGGRAALDVPHPPDAAVPTLGTGGLTGNGAGRDGGQPAPPTAFVTAECLAGDVYASRKSLSYDGRWFAFKENDQAILLDRSTGTRTVLSRDLSVLDLPVASGDGNRVVFGAAVGTDNHAFVWDRTTDGMLATFFVGDDVEGVLSHDGRFLAFHSLDASFVEPPLNSRGGSVVVDLSTNERWQVSVNDSGEPANDRSRSSDISDDGRRVVLRSYAMNLVSNKPERRFDVYLHDRSTRKTVLATAAMYGGYANRSTSDALISGDGRIVVFESDASNIVLEDRDRTDDVFVWDIEEDTVISFTLGHSNELPIALAGVSSDGRFVLIGTKADSYVAEDRNNAPDAFVYDRLLGRFESATRNRDGSTLEKGGGPIALSGDGRVVAFQTHSPEFLGDAGNFVTCFAVREP
jgi:Tol biopolymer transport system component